MRAPVSAPHPSPQLLSKGLDDRPTRPTPLISRSGSPEVGISEVVLGKISAQPNTFIL